MYPYNGIQLITCLKKQYKQRNQADLFKSGTFTLNWRAKVGSFAHPDLETLISAGEPCGSWQTVTVSKDKRGERQKTSRDSRPEEKRTLEENWQALKELPLYGYVPGSAIRGVVRAWALQFPEIAQQVPILLGDQEGNKIVPGKVQFLDAFPKAPTKLKLDIINVQQNFQVFHDGQGTPLSSYALGDGTEEINLLVGICGNAKATPEEVNTVWQWTQKALISQGIGCRTASGYGRLKLGEEPNINPVFPPGYVTKTFSFQLFSQGNAGPDMDTPELRPSHWRGWLRSWLLRFFLGVMSKENAYSTVGELLGTLEDGKGSNKQRKGSIRLRLNLDSAKGEDSKEKPRFYQWKGTLTLTGPKDIMNPIIMPILKFAVMVGGVGRGWRRPLHIFKMEKRTGEKIPWSRGSHLLIKQEKRDPVTQKPTPLGISLTSEIWNKAYEDWQSAVKSRWSEQYKVQTEINAEVFSPKHCAVFVVNGPTSEPINMQDLKWRQPLEKTRGEGMDLIYQPKYKRKPDVGGSAGSGNASCSWVSIKRCKQKETCKEVVCLFLGEDNKLRKDFLKDLSTLDGADFIFGVQSPDAKSNA
jgi:CRISPR-associated protein Cmr6